MEVGSQWQLNTGELVEITSVSDESVHFNILGSKRRKGWYARFYWDTQVQYEMIVEIFD